MEPNDLDHNNQSQNPNTEVNPLPQNPPTQLNSQQTVTPQPISSVSNNNQSSNKKIILIVAILAVIFIFAVIGFMAIKSKPINIQSTLKPTQIKNSPTIAQLPTLVQQDNDNDMLSTDINWADFEDSEMGVSFKIPDDWRGVVSAGGGGSMEYDIISPDKSAYALLGVYGNRNLAKDSDIQTQISSRENRLRSSGVYKVLQFTSLVQDGLGSFTASGEEIFIYGDVIDPIYSFSFQEKGQYKVGGKEVILHWASKPGSQYENIITQIVESFEIN